MRNYKARGRHTLFQSQLSKLTSSEFSATALSDSDDNLKRLRCRFVEDVWSMYQTKTSHLSDLLGTQSLEQHLDFYDTMLANLETFVWLLAQDLDRIYGKLAQERNVRVPVNELPDDVLRIIFDMSCEDSEAKYVMLSATNLADVCTRWNYVATNNPAMWSRIDVYRSVDVVSQFLKLSRGHEKIVSGKAIDYFQDAFPAKTFELIKHHMDRVGELSITLRDLCPLISWLDEVSSAPQLHTLSLSHLPYDDLPDDNHENDAGIPERLDFRPWLLEDISPLRNKSPNLCHLSLEGLRAPWRPGSYQNLTTLRVSKCWVGAHPPDEDIAMALCGSPQLRVLELSLKSEYDWKPEHDRLLAALKNSEGRIPLHSLQGLRLSLPHPYLFHLLRALDIPNYLPTVDLTVGSFDLRYDHGDAIPAKLFHLALLSPDALAGTRQVLLNMSNRNDSIIFTGDYGGRNFETRVSWMSQKTTIRAEVYKAIIERLPLPAVQSFELVVPSESLSGAHNIPPNFISLIGHLQNITTLRLNTGAATSSQHLPHLHTYPLLHLTTLDISSSTLNPLQLMRRTWLPSLTQNSPELKHLTFSLHKEPWSYQLTFEKSGARELQLELARVAKAYPTLITRGYADIQLDSGRYAVAQSTQVWPLASEEELASLDLGDLGDDSSGGEPSWYGLTHNGWW